MEMSRFQQGGSFYQAVKGYTSYWFIVAYGQPVHDQTTDTLLTTAPGKIDFTWTKQYTARSVQAPASTTANQKVTYIDAVFPTVAVPRTVEELNPGTVVTATGN